MEHVHGLIQHLLGEMLCKLISSALTAIGSCDAIPAVGSFTQRDAQKRSTDSNSTLRTIQRLKLIHLHVSWSLSALSRAAHARASPAESSTSQTPFLKENQTRNGPL